MRILFIAISLPYPPTSGHRLRSWGLLQALAQDGHEISLLSFAEDGEKVPTGSPLQRICARIALVPAPRAHESKTGEYLSRARTILSPLPYGALRFRSAALRTEIERKLADECPDLIVCDTIFTLWNLPPQTHCQVVLDTDDVPHSILERFFEHASNPIGKFYAWLESWKLTRFENRVTRNVAAIWTCSDEDLRRFQTVCPAIPFFVLPNVVDTDQYVPGPEKEISTLLFQAWLDWFPNRDGIEFFVSAILPELRKLVPEGFKFRVAGRGGSKQFRAHFRNAPEVEFTGPVEDMRAEVQKATLSVVPLRIGSGTRFKILEASAMGKAIVSTSLGAEGLEHVNGKEIMIVDKPQDFGRAVAELLRDPVRRQAMGAAARRRVEAQYSLPALRRAMCESLQVVMSKPSMAKASSERNREAKDLR